MTMTTAICYILSTTFSWLFYTPYPNDDRKYVCVDFIMSLLSSLNTLKSNLIVPTCIGVDEH